MCRSGIEKLDVATVSSISAATDVSRQTVYSILEVLIEERLID
ncbi:hypothetical protein PVW51_23125 [Sulfitobacter sp. PR48]|nr:hypothetical protein [Sulfitobacter sp. PR48]MDD9723603.1 hypothetical protein [Sulfitobacter sp. PR48]MDE0811820.1 hypothetical protein [Alphaproteobacteria bacterium]